MTRQRHLIASAPLLLSLALGACGAQSAGRAQEQEYYRSPSSDHGAPSGEPEGDEAVGPTPPVVPGVLIRRPPSSSGGLDGDQAGRVIFESAEALDQCYASSGGDAAGQGVVYVLLDVEARGAVSGVLVGYSDVSDRRFSRCLEEALEALRMPPAEEGSVLQVYLVFGAEGEEQGREMLAAYRAERDRSTAEAERAVPASVVGQRVRGCYERASRGRGGEGGRLVLELTLAEDGRVTSVSITEDDLEGQLDECIRITLGKLRLDVDEGAGPTLVYPVVVEPGQLDAGAEGAPSGG